MRALMTRRGILRAGLAGLATLGVDSRAEAQPALADTADSPVLLAIIPVGASPDGVGVNAVTNMAYVANVSAQSVSVIDGAARAVTATVTVGVNPRHAEVNCVTNHVYVSNFGGDSVSVLDGATNTVVAQIPVGNGPIGIGVNSGLNRVYVANQGDNTLSVIDGATNSVLTTVGVGTAPHGVAFDPSTDLVYVANGGSQSIMVLDATSVQPIATIGLVGHPARIALNEDIGHAYVTIGGGTVAVIDTRAQSVVATIDVPGVPNGIAACPATNRVYVDNNLANTFSVVNGASNALMNTLNAGGSYPRTVALNQATRQLYIADSKINSVAVFQA